MTYPDAPLWMMGIALRIGLALAWGKPGGGDDD
jgi:hypothetical protein